jgi:hypothetical protein
LLAYFFALVKIEDFVPRHKGFHLIGIKKDAKKKQHRGDPDAAVL